MFKYRVPDEILRKLNRMEPPLNLKFNIDAFPIQEDAMFHISKEQLKQIEIIAFESGYKQAIKELKQFFGIKGNGVHTK